MKTLAFLALFVLAAMPAAAQTTSGASALQYYVGTWNCTGQQTGQPATKATLTYTLDSGILHQTIDAPMMGKMKTPYMSSSSTTYDAKNNRYLTAGVSNDPAAFTGSYTMSGNTETSKDTWVSSGKPGWGKTVRTGKDTFTYTGYPTATSTKPNFKATCKRGS